MHVTLFNRENVDEAPKESGVIALYEDDELVRYAESREGIRSLLQKGFEQGLWPRTTHFKCEKSSVPLVRFHQLLAEYAADRGRLPRDNQPAAGIA